MERRVFFVGKYVLKPNKDIKRWKVGCFKNPRMENSLRGAQSVGHGPRRERERRDWD